MSCMHGKLRLGSQSSAVASRLDLLLTKPHGPYAACETVKGRRRLVKLVRTKNIPLSLFRYSSDLARLEISHASELVQQKKGLSRNVKLPKYMRALSSTSGETKGLKLRELMQAKQRAPPIPNPPTGPRKASSPTPPYSHKSPLHCRDSTRRLLIP